METDCHRFSLDGGVGGVGDGSFFSSSHRAKLLQIADFSPVLIDQASLAVAIDALMIIDWA